MEERQVAILIEQASTQRRLGNLRGALELLQRALSLDPDNTHAHADLALTLCEAQRVPAASIEANIALHLDGNDPWCHYVAAFVLRAQRKLDEAWTHCLVAIESDTNHVEARILGASIRNLRGERTEARELIAEALELDANNVRALTELARFDYHDRDYEGAQRTITAALRADASDLSAHCLAGHISLAQGNDADAESHARFVLGQSATDRDGLTLWAAIKARRSKLLGVWWRFNLFLTNRSERGQIGLVMGSFVLVRIIIILAQHWKQDVLAEVIYFAWFGFCAYTWYAPTLFRKMLQRDLAQVTLNSDY